MAGRWVDDGTGMAIGVAALLSTGSLWAQMRSTGSAARRLVKRVGAMRVYYDADLDEYAVVTPGGRQQQTYYTDDREDALATAAAMDGLRMRGSGNVGSRYRTEKEVFQVTSETGKPYNLRVVPPGGSYGRGHALTNDTNAAMLEFYWPSNKSSAVAPWGHFTGERYNLTTLVRGAPCRGLALQNDRDGRFSADTMTRALVWALGGDPESRWG